MNIAQSVTSPIETTTPAGAAAVPAAATSALKISTLPALIAREQRRRRRRLLLLWIALAIVPLSGTGVWWALRAKPIPVSQRFRLEPLTHGDLVREVRATGHVEAVSTVQVGAEISGRLSTVEADFNDHVKAGQILARFDRSSLEAQRIQIEASVAQAQAASAQARFELEQARRNLQRAETLFAHGAQSEAEHDASLSAAQLAEARLRAAEAQVQSQKAALILAQTNLSHAVIRAPIDGVIITRNVDPGQTVASVLQTPVLFSVAANLKRMRVIAAVDEADIGEVLLSQKATFTVNAYPNRLFEGVVTEVRNSPVVVQDVVTYGVVIEVANDDLALKPGMTASARIRIGSVRNVAKVPTAALRFTPPGAARDDAPGIWTLEGETPKRVLVTPGLSDGEFTEVSKGSPKEGTPILVDLTPQGKKAYGL